MKFLVSLDYFKASLILRRKDGGRGVITGKRRDLIKHHHKIKIEDLKKLLICKDGVTVVLNKVSKSSTNKLFV